MKNFSQRMGLKPSVFPIQIKGMDSGLENALWSLLDNFIWSNYKTKTNYPLQINYEILHFAKRIWTHYFDKVSDESCAKNFAYGESYGLHFKIRAYYFSSTYNEKYDLIEFIIQNIYLIDFLDHNVFLSELNNVLERKFSGYRVIDNVICPIIDQVEIDSVETALDSANVNIQKHLNTAIKYLSDKTKPDYRNSVKESISAVEVYCREITKSSSLDDALKKIESSHPINSQLKEAFKKIYFYTNGPDGIRHALMDGGIEVSFAEAKYMLVSCCAFLNYLREINTPTP